VTSPPLIVNLFTGESRISEVMAGPWQDIRVTRVTAGDAHVLSSVATEHAGFVISGAGGITSASGEAFALMPGVAFAIPRGGSVSLTAEADLQFLHVEMRVGRE
jgi:hypothetical protein